MSDIIKEWQGEGGRKKRTGGQNTPIGGKKVKGQASESYLSQRSQEGMGWQWTPEKLS